MVATLGPEGPSAMLHDLAIEDACTLTIIHQENGIRRYNSYAALDMLTAFETCEHYRGPAILLSHMGLFQSTYSAFILMHGWQNPLLG